MSTYIDISLPLSNTATVTFSAAATAGTYDAVITVNGLPYYEIVTADGTDITMNNIFQANTMHNLKIYDTAGDLLDDTIYMIQTPVIDSSGVTSTHTVSFVSGGGETELVNSLFIGASDISVFSEREFLYDAVKTSDDTIQYPYPLPGRQTITIKVLR